MDRIETDHSRMTRRHAVRMLGAALVVAFAGVSLSACGKKSPPEPPTDKSGKEIKYPRAYPDPKSY